MYVLYFIACSCTTVTLKVAVEMWHMPVLEQGMKYVELHVEFYLDYCDLKHPSSMNQHYALECLYGFLTHCDSMEADKGQSQNCFEREKKYFLNLKKQLKSLKSLNLSNLINC